MLSLITHPHIVQKPLRPLIIWSYGFLNDMRASNFHFWIFILVIDLYTLKDQ